MGGGGWFYVPKVRFEEYECRSVWFARIRGYSFYIYFPRSGRFGFCQLYELEVVQDTLALMNRLNPSFRLAKCSKFVGV